MINSLLLPFTFCLLPFQLVDKLLSELCNFRRDDCRAIGLRRIVGKIFLMIIFRRIKFIECGDFRDDRPVVNFGFRDFFDDLFGNAFLLVRMIKDRRTIRTADVVSLPIERRRIVNREKDAQKIGKRKLLRIEFDLCDFGVAGRFRTNLRVCRIFRMSARIARNDICDAS